MHKLIPRPPSRFLVLVSGPVQKESEERPYGDVNEAKNGGLQRLISQIKALVWIGRQHRTGRRRLVHAKVTAPGG